MKYLIVGGNSAIGKKIIEVLIADDHECIVLSRSAVDIEHKHVKAFAADVVKGEFPDNWLPEHLDGMVYLPGTVNLKPFRMLKPEDFITDFEINLLGAVKTIQYASKALKNGKNPGIVMFSSVAVNVGMPFHASISAAKGAVEGFVKSLAAEFAPKIRVNCVAPSLTETPSTTKLLSNDKKRQASEERHPLKAIGSTSDMAHAVTFLLSEKARWMTGQVIGIDGGLSSLKV